MAVPLLFSVHPAARHSAPWCRRFLPCSPSRSSANGPARPIGSVSFSSPLASIWQAEDRWWAEISLPPPNSQTRSLRKHPVLQPLLKSVAPSNFHDMNDASVLASKLSVFPRIGLANLPTPLEPMRRLTAYLGGPRLWV